MGVAVDQLLEQRQGARGGRGRRDDEGQQHPPTEGPVEDDVEPGHAPRVNDRRAPPWGKSAVRRERATHPHPLGRGAATKPRMRGYGGGAKHEAGRWRSHHRICRYRYFLATWEVSAK